MFDHWILGCSDFTENFFEPASWVVSLKYRFVSVRYRNRLKILYQIHSDIIEVYVSENM